MAKRKFSAKQIAAQKKFAAAAKAGTLRKGSKLKSKSGGSKKGKSGGKKGGRSMAKGKKGRKKSKQGIVSWLVNVASLGIIAANPIARRGIQRDDHRHHPAQYSSASMIVITRSVTDASDGSGEWPVRARS